MQYALRLAERQLGQVWPNPAVGCVVVQGNHIVGVGNTQSGGRPHAETEALAMAGERARGATLYVTLEPCSHHGHTPPCVDAIITAGIKRVVIACADIDPRVSGRGIAALRQTGIEVITGIEESHAVVLNEGFFRRVSDARPLVTLKIATSLDHKMAYPHGGPRWITGEKARDYGQWLRSRHDAILTGIGTVLADDPLLTCRLPGLEDRSPVRIVLDRQERLPPSSKIYQTKEEVPLWELEAKYRAIPALLTYLAERGITRLMVEAGPTLTTAFLESGLADWFYWFRAPMTIGDDRLAQIVAQYIG
jgi:diaminohydroxyphosphoribosylaminopyrimidine deaminase/5-amino-6-(5-phosphoribosylamino)uracil reductase